MPAAAEVVQPPMASPFLDTISASVPFDYRSPPDTPHPLPLSSPILCEDSQRRRSSPNVSFFLRSLDDDTISVSSQEFDNVTEDDKIKVKVVSPEHSPQELIKLQLIAQSSSLRPRMSPVEQQVTPEEFEHRPFYSPQIQVKLYRPKSLASLHHTTLEKSFSEVNGKGIVKKSVSTSDVRVPHSSLKSKLKKRLQFTSQRSMHSLNGIHEDIELQSPSSDENSERGSPINSKLESRKGVFSWNFVKTSLESSKTRKSKNHVVLSTRNIPNSSNNIHSNRNSGTSNGTQESSSVVTDNRKLENETYASAENSSEDLNELNPRGNELATIKIARRGSFRGGQYCTLVRNFSTILPPDEIAEHPLIIKDATDVFPLNSGEVLVTDILSNKMVMFNVHGMPKITYAMEPGSEPWSSYVTPDGIMAVTLKGAGCVSLWSPTGESLTEFGEDVLTSPTGLHYDHKECKFIVADEHNNTILSFSKTGQFLGEFGNQQSPNSAVGNAVSDVAMSQEELRFNQPRYICGSLDGLRFVSDSANQVVRIFDKEGVLLQEIGSYGKEDGQFRFPYGVAFDDDTKLLYVADHYNNRVSVFSLNGSFLYHILTQADGITRPKGLAIHRSKLFVTFGNLRAGNISVYRIHANRDS